jgi:uncharacterized protein (DUF1800 family)
MTALLLGACGGGGGEAETESAVSAPAPAAPVTPETPAAPDTPASPPTEPVVTAPVPKQPLLVVRARADVAGGIGAQMEVRLDGQLLGTASVDSSNPADYSFTPPAVLATGARIDITFTNDGVVGTEDRNLYVHYVSDGDRFLLPNTASAVVDKGVGAAAFDGANTVAGQSGLYWAASLRLQWPAAPTATDQTARFAASRLLQQGSFGPTTADIDRVVRLGAAGWVDEQLALPHQPVFVTEVQQRYARGEAWRPPNGASYSNQWPAQRFWANVVQAPDQLRRRTAFALHHMLMVSTADSNLYHHTRAYAQYLDTLNQHAFGNYRDLIEAIALSPAMGIYLSHMRNQPEDTASGRTPDENFARELMQLFSIGLLELNTDGSLKRNASGQPIETYGNADVMALAKVFTGWSWGFPDNELTANNFRWKSPSLATAAGDTQVDLLPMKPYPGQHSTAAKPLFAGKAWAVTIPANTGARESLRIALDTLANHPNVGPFVGRQLIQRLVTSDPSPAYVARVAAVFNDNGRGVRGDLGAVVRAILLDAEARTTPATDPGKLREPVLRMAHWMRAFGASSVSGEFQSSYEGQSLQQQVLSAASVFGYFRPGYVPPNTTLSAAGRTAPEFQLVNETTVAQWMNLAQQMATSGLGWANNARDVTTSYPALTALTTNGDLDGLLAHLDLLLYAGRMPASVRADIAESVAGVAGQTAADHLNRARVAVFAAVSAPEYLVQR